MLFDIGWPELLLIGAVALVVIGPKDLPRALKVAGFWVRKARTLSREFQNSVDQMIREAELEEMRQEVKKATEFNVENEIRKTIDPDGSLAESIAPPHVPDHFEETPVAVGPVEPASAEPWTTEPVGSLAAPVETPLPEPTPVVESTPEPAVPPPAGCKDPAEHSPEARQSSAPLPAHEPTSPDR